MAVSVFRRYTPPTCTLELQGERSPLSVWSDRPIVKGVQFILSIDGPHRHPDQRVTIKGKRPQLDQLHEVFTTYVQQTLDLSAQDFYTQVLSEPVTPDVSLFNRSPLADPASTLEWSKSAASSSADSIALEAQPGEPRSNPRGQSLRKKWATAISLRPQGLLKHKLELGSLAATVGNNAVLLSTTELFDLANALDAYHSEIDSIPELNPQRYHRPAPWLKVSAVAVLAVGVGVSLMRLSQNTAQYQQELASDVQGGSSAPSVAGESDSSPPTNFRLPTIPSASEPLSQQPSDNAARDPSATSDRNRRGNRQNDRAQDAEVDEDVVAIAPAPTPGNSSLNADTTAEAVASAPGEASADDAIAGNTAPESPNAPVPSPQSEAAVASPGEPLSMDIPEELATIPPISPQQTGDIFMDSSEINLSVPPASIPMPEIASDQASEIPADNLDSETRAAEEFATRTQINESLADLPSPATTQTGMYPQLAEVQNYFAARWQPPANLEQTLQYRLLFNLDGSLAQVIPLGEFARSSGSLVNFPAAGQPIVSPFSGNDSPPMRLFLAADGKVRVFLDSGN